MGWRLWPDVCKEYYGAMYYVYDLMVCYNGYQRDLPLRRFFVELQKSDLPEWAKENFLTMFSGNFITWTNIYFANKKIIEDSEKAEEWKKEQEKGMKEIIKIVADAGKRELIKGEISEEEKKYVGISMLPDMLSGEEYIFIIDGIVVKGTKEEFTARFKTTLLSDKVQKDNSLEEKVSDTDKTSKASEYAEQLIENIENGTLQRKTYLTHGEKHSRDLEELMQYKSQKYLGSLRCWLDTRTMKSIYATEEEKDKSFAKILKKK